MNKKIISIDYGEKYCGIAVLIEGVVVPKDIIDRYKVISYLRKLKKEYNFEVIVIGYPFHLDKSISSTGDKVDKFILGLLDSFDDISIEKIDERFTSNFFGDSKARIDDMSASLLLENYIQKNKESD